MTRPLPPGLPVALDADVSLWAGGRVATGGSPWRLARFKDAAGPHLAALRRAGARGLAPASPVGRALARQLVDRGLAHPVPAPRPGPHPVTVVVPAYRRPDELARCLAALAGLSVIVVDDGSPDAASLRDVADAHGAVLVRHTANRGPAAARNTGLALARSPFVAFVDSDCRPEPGWLDTLVPYFDDPRVAAVAPRIVPDGIADDAGESAGGRGAGDGGDGTADTGAAVASDGPLAPAPAKAGTQATGRARVTAGAGAAAGAKARVRAAAGARAGRLVEAARTAASAVRAAVRGTALARSAAAKRPKTFAAARTEPVAAARASAAAPTTPTTPATAPAPAAPPTRTHPTAHGLLLRYEHARSSLDMGVAPALVRPGSKVGFVPTATLIVRRDAVQDTAFDEEMRLGEDVDFVWRLDGLGHHVRYQPQARVAHTPRLTWSAWARRRHEYGTSAAALAARHPGRLAPLRPSGWNLLTLALLARGKPLPAAGSAVLSAALLRRGLAGTPSATALSATVVAKGLTADAVAVGHALRREWWPLGLLCLAASPRGATARAAAAAMLAPVAAEWWTRRPARALDPVRWIALRLADDLCYGTGVTASAWRDRSAAALLPDVRFPIPGR
ncbi:glycosyltransferase [Yinghuangia sp. ASG 101]|uniref:glycosyltransferase n=1 Tax=Yinghuangia sp. ASG 101 TaxID=2896848 RepID=UPI001E507EC8|nr:glycosyltransferase [Yinghuangia sp. ASG 101]UGQ12655.1 glycosyltransferase [Yinghuangia sp. ASG 101]